MYLTASTEKEMSLVDINQVELRKYLNYIIDTDNFKEIPLQLILFEGSKFIFNEEAKTLLNSIEDDVILISVVGKARSGKSYLMNLLLDNVGKDTGVSIS